MSVYIQISKFSSILRSSFYEIIYSEFTSKFLSIYRKITYSVSRNWLLFDMLCEYSWNIGRKSTILGFFIKLNKIEYIPRPESTLNCDRIKTKLFAVKFLATFYISMSCNFILRGGVYMLTE